MDRDVEARLVRAELSGEQIKAVFDVFDGLDAEGQQTYRDWLQRVSNQDIADVNGLPPDLLVDKPAPEVSAGTAEPPFVPDPNVPDEETT